MISRLQSLLRWAFMRVEAMFNAAFGDRPNPLYHLGSITFMLFWLVAGSGLYLYAFFKTGVTGAYASVDALTHHQWYAGGVMRSVHRYASDAMVLTMLLHMLRHFAFDRLRGFRWFSWVSGVVLIWGVYVSGVNGYMLPWDQLAQFVIVASFEWLDWLPGFGGTLIRNFIYPYSVNDRFFSLLSFMHIGIPLVVLLLMWIHVQRVPKARTSPPRPLMLSVVLTLVALSLVKPALSQGGAAEPRRLPGHPAARLVLPCDISAPLPVAAGAGVGLAGCGHRGGHRAAMAAPAPQAQQGGRIPHDGLRPRQPVTGTRRRDAARRRPAPRPGAALRVPQRRLWSLPVHGAARKRRPRRVSAQRIAGRAARTG